MIFAGLGFIFHFLPVFLLVYYIVPIKRRSLVLLLGSLVFYALGNSYYVILLIISVLVNYLISYMIYKHPDYYDELDEIDNINNSGEIEYRNLKSAKSFSLSRAWLIVAIIYNIGLLFVFKYYDTAAVGVGDMLGIDMPLIKMALPVGISFYTFQMLSFIFDVYRGKYIEGVSLYSFAVYATSFTQITAGPIVRYENVRNNIENPSKVSSQNIENGIIWFILGLSYKVLLADKMSSLWNDIYRVGAQGMDVATAWLGAIGYSMNLYFDFLGYSLMALGAALMLGFRLPDNFNEPYSAKTMTSFWRRWHITLGLWFRDYLYIPLGGNRCSTFRTIMNLFFVWVLTAIWHGASANFLIWGIFLFVVITLEKLTYGKYMENTKLLGHVYMLILIPVSWIIFGINDVQILCEYLLRMVGVAVPGMAVVGFNKFISLSWTYWWIVLIGIVFCTPIPMKLVHRFYNKVVFKMILFALFWVSIYELTISGNNPFIYFAF